MHVYCEKAARVILSSALHSASLYTHSSVSDVKMIHSIALNPNYNKAPRPGNCSAAVSTALTVFTRAPCVQPTGSRPRRGRDGNADPEVAARAHTGLEVTILRLAELHPASNLSTTAVWPGFTAASTMSSYLPGH